MLITLRGKNKNIPNLCSLSSFKQLSTEHGVKVGKIHPRGCALAWVKVCSPITSCVDLLHVGSPVPLCVFPTSSSCDARSTIPLEVTAQKPFPLLS